MSKVKKIKPSKAFQTGRFTNAPQTGRFIDTPLHVGDDPNGPMFHSREDLAIRRYGPLRRYRKIAPEGMLIQVLRDTTNRSDLQYMRDFRAEIEEELNFRLFQKEMFKTVAVTAPFDITEEPAKVRELMAASGALIDKIGVKTAEVKRLDRALSALDQLRGDL